MTASTPHDPLDVEWARDAAHTWGPMAPMEFTGEWTAMFVARHVDGPHAREYGRQQIRRWAERLGVQAMIVELGEHASLIKIPPMRLDWPETPVSWTLIGVAYRIPITTEAS